MQFVAILVNLGYFLDFFAGTSCLDRQCFDHAISEAVICLNKFEAFVVFQPDDVTVPQPITGVPLASRGDVILISWVFTKHDYWRVFETCELPLFFQKR